MILIRQMRVIDIPAVMEIDRLSFPMPWSARSYEAEILKNEQSHFFVAEPTAGETDFQLVGYVGYWFIIDEAHISTIAVHPQWRGMGVGEKLLLAALDDALTVGATEASLEVRISNEVAQRLYRKYGFVETGTRKFYYRDNGEDALIMTAKPIRLERIDLGS